MGVPDPRVVEALYKALDPIVKSTDEAERLARVAADAVSGGEECRVCGDPRGCNPDGVCPPVSGGEDRPETVEALLDDGGFERATVIERRPGGRALLRLDDGITWWAESGEYRSPAPVSGVGEDREDRPLMTLNCETGEVRPASCLACEPALRHLEVERDQLREALERTRDTASMHRFRELCPDRSQPDSRDPLCAACKALFAADAALAGSVSDKDREPTWESVDRIDLTTGDAIEAYVIDAEGFEWCRATVLSVDPLRVRWSDGTEKSWVDRPDDCLPRLRRSVSDKDRAPKR